MQQDMGKRTDWIEWNERDRRDRLGNKDTIVRKDDTSSSISATESVRTEYIRFDSTGLYRKEDH